jgi:predicted transcriptional regulator
VARRRRIILDGKTEKLLDKLAAERSVSRVVVLREALKTYAAMEQRLGEIEKDPTFIKMMKKSDADIRAGRIVPHEEVVKTVREKTRNSRLRS